MRLIPSTRPPSISMQNEGQIFTHCMHAMQSCVSSSSNWTRLIRLRYASDSSGLTCGYVSVTGLRRIWRAVMPSPVTSDFSPPAMVVK